MKKLFTAILLFLVFLSSNQWAGAQMTSSHPEPAKQDVSGDTIVQLKDRMWRMRKLYTKLEGTLSQKPPDYDSLLKALEEMEGNLKMIQKVNPYPEFEMSFNRLGKDIRDFKSEARRKNPSGVENSMNTLYENCFRCHLTHSSK